MGKTVAERSPKTLRLNELFVSWGREIGQGGFHADGIICESAFAKARPRVLIILKDVNNNCPYGDLRQFLSDEANFPRWGSTYTRIARWVFGIVHGGASWEILAQFASSDRVWRHTLHSHLQLCAVINLKKNPGVDSLSDRALRHSVQQSLGHIREEIEIIGPEVIVCGGTFDVTKDLIFPASESLPSDGLQECTRVTYGKLNSLVVRSAHPADRGKGVTDRSLYDPVIQAVQSHYWSPQSFFRNN